MEFVFGSREIFHFFLLVLAIWQNTNIMRRPSTNARKKKCALGRSVACQEN
jgi:hypothetical protein